MQRKRRRKNEERKSKKITGYLYISYGSHDLFRTASAGGSTQDVYNSAGKTWTRYDITGDGKKDRIKVVRKKSQYDGCWNGADIYVNNTKVCAINKAFMDMSIRIITLSNGKPFLCLRGGTDNDISVFHGLYQYRNGKIVQVVNFINETYGRPVNEAKIYLR